MQVTTTGSEVVEATADVPAAAPGSLSAPRGGTKLARVLELLQRDCGATLEELITATDWLPHTTRAALTGLRKRGCAVTIDRHDRERGSTYRARLGETIETGDAAGQSDAPPATPCPEIEERSTRGEAASATHSVMSQGRRSGDVGENLSLQASSQREAERLRHVGTRRARADYKGCGFSSGCDGLAPRAHRCGAEQAV